MAISEAKKRADDKWKRKNNKVLGVRLPLGEAEAFAAACQRTGVTRHSVLLAAVRAYIRDHPPTPETSGPASSSTPSSADALPDDKPSLPPDAPKP